MGYVSQPEQLEISRAVDLHKAGLRSSILQLEWPQDGDPLQLSNFETVARNLRYMALGKACLERNIQSLLVAHHKDDQAETVMMRIAQGQRGTGLKSILPVSDIPECWGTHGVHQSGESEVTANFRAAIQIGAEVRGQPNPFPERGDPNEDLDEENSPPLTIEDGGIKIYRPLLGFDKERLKATCRHHLVSWFEDKTNHDVALTPRNAVRQILQTGKLPEALQKASLSALAERMREKDTIRRTRAEKLFHICDINMFDTRVGAVIIRFVSGPFDLNKIPAPFLHQVTLNKEYHYAMLLRRAMELVSPTHHVSLQILSPAVKTIFSKLFNSAATEPELEPDPDPDPGRGKPKTLKFTCGDVHFERIPSPSQHAPRTSGKYLDHNFVWILTRKPYISNQPPPTLTFPTTTTEAPLTTQPYTSNHPTPTLTSPTTTTTDPLTTQPFTLWDGRFWFRIHNPTPKPITIRPLLPTDLTHLRTSLPQKSHLNHLLGITAPSKTRWTLPVLAEVSERERENEKQNYKERKQGRVLALPSLGLDFGAREAGISWEVRYKKVDLRQRGNVDGIVL